MKYNYKVCTRCFTYNHGPFIKSALDGFAIQQTSFPVVTVIVDDASTDNTADVIRQYMKNNFDFEDSDSYQIETEYAHIDFARHKTNKNCFFVVLYLKENHYQNGRNDEKYEYLSEWVDNAEYIAICEGDDYWTATDKLQVQVEAMDQHPEVDISAHAYKRVHALTGETVDERSLSEKEIVFPPEKAIMGEGGFVGTPTLMLRQSLWINKDKYPFWKQMSYDYTLQMAGSLRGGMLYLPEIMVNKRTRVPGSFTNRHRAASRQLSIDYNNQKAAMLVQLDTDTKGKYHNTIYARILLNNIRGYRSVKDNKYILHKYRDGMKCLPIFVKVRILTVCYLSAFIWLYRRIRYGKDGGF